MTTPPEPQPQAVVRNRLAMISIALGVVAMFVAMFQGPAFVNFIAAAAAAGGMFMGWRGMMASKALGKGRNWAISGLVISAVALLTSFVLIFR